MTITKRKNIMDLLQLAKKRYSAKSYSDKKVEKEKIDYILEAGRVAPSAVLKQNHRILVVESDEGLCKLANACRTHKPALILIVCSDSNNSWINPFDNHSMTDIDCAIVSTHMMLAAAERGVDSVWLNWFDTNMIKSDFNIPDHYSVVNLLALGYSDKPAHSPDRHHKTRKPIESTVFYEKF